MEKLITAAELAEHLSLAVWTVRRMTRDGELPCVRVGSVVRYRLSDVLPQQKEKLI